MSDTCTRCGNPGATVLVPQKGGDRMVHEAVNDCEASAHGAGCSGDCDRMPDGAMACATPIGDI